MIKVKEKVSLLQVKALAFTAQCESTGIVRQVFSKAHNEQDVPIIQTIK